jgi:hypothetical protein
MGYGTGTVAVPAAQPWYWPTQSETVWLFLGITVGIVLGMILKRGGF